MKWFPGRSVCAVVTLALTTMLSSPVDAQSSRPVVVGGYGFGMETRAAYGGSIDPMIYRVDNLNDRGPGSLRDALEAYGPRIVIFEISGTIELQSAIYIAAPYLTVAGQTAPSPGITVRNYGIQIDTNDVLLQHFRVRPGGDTCNNGIEAWGSAPYNIVLDHMSVSWSQDENLVLHNPTRPINATVWRTITAEGLHMTPYSASCPGGLSESHGLLIADHTKNVSVLQSLFAHNSARNPYAKGDTTTYIANNVFYNFVEASLFMDPDGSGPSTVHSTLVGNYYRRGINTPATDWISGSRFLQSGSRLYRWDNLRDSGLEDFLVINSDGIDPTVGSPPVLMTGYFPMRSTSTYGIVLTSVGARPADRDAVDDRLINDVSQQWGTFVRHQNDVGGWPPLRVNRRALSPPWNLHSVTSSGYTAMEEWLHAFAAEVERDSVLRLMNLGLTQDVSASEEPTVRALQESAEVGETSPGVSIVVAPAELETGALPEVETAAPPVLVASEPDPVPAPVETSRIRRRAVRR